MERQYYLRGELRTAAAVDDVVAVREGDAGVRRYLADEDESARGARDTVRDAASGVDDAALDAFERAGWQLRSAGSGLRSAQEAGTVPAVSPDLGIVVVPPDGRPVIATDLVTLQLAGDPSPAEADAILASANLVPVNVLHFAPHLFEARTTVGDALSASATLHEDPRFAFVEPALVEFVPGRFTPTDPRFAEQWQWANSGANGGTAGADVHAEEAWDHTFGAGIRIAVIDNGFDADHEDLAAGVGPASGFFTANAGNPATFTASVAGMPDGPHGTQCAGMAGARQGNGVGGSGAAPAAELTLIAALGDQIGTQVTLARAIAYAADPTSEPGAPANPGADIIVSSLGPNGADWALTTVLDLALQNAAANGRGGLGCVIFWAASNGHDVDVLRDEVVSHPDVIAVVRSNRNDLEDNAARGPEVELIAPGVDVLMPTSGNGYVANIGTSFAAPCAAGVAALALSVRPAMTRDELRLLMRDTADKIGGVVYDAAGHNDDYGFGRVNAERAVLRAGRSIALLTPTVEFADVPEGETTARAVVWEVASLEDLTFEVTAGPTTTSGATGFFSLVLGASTTLPAPGLGAVAKARIWIGITATAAGDTAAGSISVRCVETNETWVVPLSANVIARPTAAVAMVLDRSGSMGWPAGDGRTRVEVLRDAANVFGQVLKPNTGVGVVRFDHDANTVMNVVDAGPEIFGPGRAQFAAAIAGHTPNPAGGTSIGDGVASGSVLLDGAAPNYDTTAMLVLTDGQENAPLFISDVSGSIDDTVFAVGLGEPADINPVALTALTDGTGGYVQVTGQISIDEQFVLAKYYLQILAGVGNDQIVLDPDGYLQPGDVVKIPFPLVSVDSATDVILLSPAPYALEFTLVSPDGVTVTPASSGVAFVQGEQVAYYRFSLPLLDPAAAVSSHAGEWTAILAVEGAGYEKYLAHLEGTDLKAYELVRERGIRYLVEIHSTSALRFAARVRQDGIAPGSVMRLSADLTEIGIPVGADRAAVRAEIETPYGPDQLDLKPLGDDVWSADFVAARPGLYRFRVIAEGKTFHGELFTREQALTGSIYEPNKPDDGGDSDCDRVIDVFVDTVRGDLRLAKTLDIALQRNGISLEQLWHCLGRGRSGAAGEAAAGLPAAGVGMDGAR